MSHIVEYQLFLKENICAEITYYQFCCCCLCAEVNAATTPAPLSSAFPTPAHAITTLYSPCVFASSVSAEEASVRRNVRAFKTADSSHIIEKTANACGFLRYRAFLFLFALLL